MGESEDLLIDGKMDGKRLQASDGAGKHLIDEPLDLTDREAAIHRMLDWLSGDGQMKEIHGIGFRIVHGGPDYTEPVLIGPEVIAALKKIVPLAPDHLPDQIATVECIGKALPHLAAVACFDTSFHRTMPRYAQVFGLPQELIGQGVIRYGFHGLSYTFIVGELSKEGALPERLIVAHLGSGASMAAIRDGKSIDTSMGLTPTGGFMMSNRSGDLDPGVILMLMRDKKMSVDQVADLVNKNGGLKGLSGIGGDMRTLEKESPKSVYVFCYQVKKFLGAYIAAMGGVDTVVFTGGIGENSSTVRSWVCGGLERLGIEIDPSRNEAAAAIISTDKSAVMVRVMKTNEEIIIARSTAKLLM
jgi:acetate kinase